MKNNAYYIKSHILNYINKRKYSSAKNLINLLYLNERKKGVYSYVKDLINYLEEPYDLSSKEKYNYQTYENFYKHFYEALRNKDYLEAYLTIKDEDYSNDFDKKIIKTLLEQIYDLNRYNSANINIIVNNILENGLTSEDIIILKKVLAKPELDNFEYYILEIINTKELLNGNSVEDFSCSLDIYQNQKPNQIFELAMQYGDYLKALQILETKFYQNYLDKKEIKKYEFIKCLLNNLLSNEELKSKEEIKKEKFLNKKMKKLNNLDRYVNSELFVRAMRYYKKQKRFFNEEDNLFYETMFKYGISCLKYEYEIVKDDNSDEVKRLIKKLEIGKK